jgi:predicted nucleic acid-binding protein
VLDAGPLIALLHGKDPDHTGAVVGFERLARARSRLVTPLPVVFEVYKWLVYEAGPAPARRGLARMRQGLEIIYPAAVALEEVVAVVEAMPNWAGTPEDALVALTGLRMGAPVWTLNFRDLSAFRNLQLWAPH